MKYQQTGILVAARQWRLSGITLIELMITLAIMAILASIAYPRYSDYVTRSKRSEGRTALLDAAAKLERHYSDNGEYPATLSDAAIQATTENKYYTLSLQRTNAYTFTLSAAPQSPQMDDPECGTLSITQSGAKSVSGKKATVKDCWSK